MISIYVDTPSYAIPLCRDVTGKEMKLACIYNTGPEHTVIFVEHTPLRYGIMRGEYRHCVVVEDDVTRETELVVMYPCIVHLEDCNLTMEPNHPKMKNVLYDGEFQFCRDGLVYLNGYPIKYSNHGNPFSYVRDNIAVDSQGFLWGRGYQENDFYMPWIEYDKMPQDPRFIFAMSGGELGLTQDRRIWYLGQYVSSIPDPVIDIVDSFFGIMSLTCSGEVYYLKKRDKSLQAVLVAQGATAIADLYQSHYFAFSDEQANLHIYEDFGYRNIDAPPTRIIKTGAKRVSELVLYQNILGCRYVPYGFNRYSASSGEEYRRW